MDHEYEERSVVVDGDYSAVEIASMYSSTDEQHRERLSSMRKRIDAERLRYLKRRDDVKPVGWHRRSS